MNESILTKIKFYRLQKGWSYENMARDLGISIGAYRKIETNKTKLTLERLNQIAQIFNRNILDFFEDAKGRPAVEAYFGLAPSGDELAKFFAVLEQLIAVYESRIKEQEKQIRMLKCQRDKNKDAFI